jgi:hypothetical protein
MRYDQTTGRWALAEMTLKRADVTLLGITFPERSFLDTMYVACAAGFGIGVGLIVITLILARSPTGRV